MYRFVLRSGRKLTLLALVIILAVIVLDEARVVLQADAKWLALFAVLAAMVLYAARHQGRRGLAKAFARKRGAGMGIPRPNHQKKEVQTCR